MEGLPLAYVMIDKNATIYALMFQTEYFIHGYFQQRHDNIATKYLR